MPKQTKYKIVLIISTILMAIYFGWRLFFTFPFKYGIVAMVCAVILFACELVSAIEAFIHLLSSMNPVVPEKPDIPLEWYPDVDVFIATHNESTDVLYKTINGCKYMKYPDKSKVHIWICDDGYRQEVKELAERMGVGWQGLQNNKLAKAGNLNNALAHTSAPLVVTFDADMIPTRDFLMETVPYFFLPKMKKLKDGSWVERSEKEIDPNYKIGFIQTPQNFYNPDLFQYNLYAEGKVPNEQDYFFREINVSRNKSNSPIYAGSNTVISRQALEEVGGIATGTITEDFETGIHIQGRGYSCYAINKVVAHGLAPDSIDSLIKQRERWGRGCVYSLRKMHIWTNDEMPLASKISYYSCQIYWWTFLRRFVFILCPIIFAVFSIPVMECKPWELLLFWLPSYFMFNMAQQMESGGIRTNRWSNIIDTIMFPYLIIPIMLEALGFAQHKFVVTRKDRVIEENNDVRLAVPHGILLTFSIISLVLSISDLIKYKAFGSIIIIYWLAVNAFALTMAIFFMLGRRNMRMTERYKVDLPAKVIFLDKTYYGEAIDVSEEGLAISLDEPALVPEGIVRIHVKTHHYNAHFNAKLVYATDYAESESGERKYRYSFIITDLDEANKSQYYQLIYDREPSLPSFTDKNDSLFANLADNFAGRVEGVNEQKRRLYRLDINRELPEKDGKKAYIYDYNYRYAALNWSRDIGSRDREVIIDKDMVMKCKFVRNFDDNRALYKIKNNQDLVFNEKFDEILARWDLVG